MYLLIKWLKVMKKINNFFISIIVVLGLIGCSITPDEVIQTRLNGYTYNSLARNYLDRPTEVSLRGDTFVVKVQGYGQDDIGMLTVDREDVDETMAALDKYLEWDSLATKRGDVITKNISKVGSYTYAIFGTKPGEHFFISHIPVLGDHLDVNYVGQLAVLFPRDEVIELRKLLVQFKTNSFKRPDMSVYK
ncbi:hypothetical protein BZG81_14220 [Salinivibrio sp. MA607]|nr:hypothetical protein BZG81_14220 [Salinivibrio sp. MA607]